MLKLGTAYLALLRIFHAGQKEGDGLLLGRIDGRHSGTMMRLIWHAKVDVVKDATVEVGQLGLKKSDVDKDR